jgi:adenine-specific DNA-methyltransferase
MMNYFRDQFGITYAPNTRETVRRQTIHQFVQMNLVIPNPDDPDRPINSPKTRYQMESNLLALIKSFGTDAWENKLRNYLATA